MVKILNRIVFILCYSVSFPVFGSEIKWKLITNRIAQVFNIPLTHGALFQRCNIIAWKRFWVMLCSNGVCGNWVRDWVC
jgi:hypothetical protein